MPHFASNEDRSLQSTIEEWKLTARSELDDIEGWRDAVYERSKHLGDSSRYWWDEPNGFYSETTYLVGVIVSRYPKLDPAPLQKFYAAVQAWHADNNASRIPAQSELNAIADQAVMALNAIEITIQSRRARLEEVREQTNEHFVLIDSWTPFGWEGKSPDRVLNSVVELAAWIDDQLIELNALADMNDGRGSFYLDTANQSLRNAFRAMDRLRISHPWQQPEATADPLVAEQRLRNLRQELRKLTHVDTAHAASKPNNETPKPPIAVPPRCPVELCADGKTAIVCGVEKKLRSRQFAVVKAIVDSFPTRLKKDDLDRRSTKTDAHKVLAVLSTTDPDWQKAIYRPGQNRDGYGLIAVS